MSRSWALLSTLALVVGVVVVAPAAAVAQTPAGCPVAASVDDVTPGTLATGYTVASGTTPEPFDVEVVDVLEDAVAPGIPLVVVETDSAAIDAAGGIWAGMSGSPVYLDDGRLLGAVGYGFSFGPSKLGGVTPAAAMLEVPTRPTLPGPIQPADAGDASITMPSRIRTMAAAEAGVPTRQAAAMRPLQVPVGIAGPTGRRFDRVADAFERAHPGTTVVRSAGAPSAAAAAGEIVPGGNLAVSLAYGDYSAVGVGTVTTVCDGVVTGFGHPMLWDGATRLGLHTARAVTVVADPVMGPYKLANAGPLVGTIEQDRLAAISGRLGAIPPTLAVTTDITETDGGRRRVGRTDGVHPDDVFGTVLVHGWTNYDAGVLDDYGFAGTSEVRWTIAGLRADGSPFEVTRTNRHASPEDLSTASLLEVAGDAQALHDNPFEQVRLTAVDYEASAGSPFRALAIQSRDVEVSVAGEDYLPAREGVMVEPGDRIRIRVPLRLTRGATSTVVLSLDVPDDLEAGSGEIVVTGGGGGEGDGLDCLFYPEECGGVEAASFTDLLDQIETRPRGDDLTASLFVDGFDEELDWFDEAAGPPDAIVTRRVAEVVDGEVSVPVEVLEGFEPELCPSDVEVPFVDVGRGSTHHDAIGCAYDLGIVRGAGGSPPRFLPARPVTRDQAAAFVARTLDLGDRPLPAAGDGPFTDLAGNTHRRDIARLHAAGVIQGTTPTTFDPRSEVTRQQVAAMLMRGLRWSTGESFRAVDGPYFTDVRGTHAADVDAGYEIGLIQGRDDGTFRPLAPTRRDQMATLLVRFHGIQTGW